MGFLDKFTKFADSMATPEFKAANAPKVPARVQAVVDDWQRIEQLHFAGKSEGRFVCPSENWEHQFDAVVDKVADRQQQLTAMFERQEQGSGMFSAAVVVVGGKVHVVVDGEYVGVLYDPDGLSYWLRALEEGQWILDAKALVRDIHKQGSQPYYGVRVWGYNPTRKSLA